MTAPGERAALGCAGKTNQWSRLSCRSSIAVYSVPLSASIRMTRLLLYTPETARLLHLLLGVVATDLAT